MSTRARRDAVRRDVGSPSHRRLVPAAVVEGCSEAFAEAVGRLHDPIVVAQDAARAARDGRRHPARAAVPRRPHRLSVVGAGPPPPGAIANCEADGSITIRDDGGALTLAGRDRFARVVAGALP